MRHIDEFTIHRFRGIRDLKLEGLGQINLLVGDNNSGKTSVLEALFIFCDSLSREEWLNAISMREIGSSSSGLSLREQQREQLIWLFPQGEDHSDNGLSDTDPKILLSASGSFPVEKVDARYEEIVQYPLSAEDQVGFEEREVKGVKVHVSSSIRQTQQESLSDKASKETSRLSSILEFSNRVSLQKVRRQKITVLPAQIINPFSHRLDRTSSRLWSDVINAETKPDAIKLLRFFDADIVDVDIVLAAADRPTVSVKRGKLGRAPLSTFGDGLRRVFTLAAAISGAKGGLLLVDELETAIHTRALEKTFDWLVKACVQNNVQLFATTHSLEAVDAVLEAYGESVDLVAYRLQKGKEQTTTTRFDKELLKQLREELGLEVR